MRDGKAFGAEIVSIVKGFMDKSLASIVGRLDALEKAEPPKATKGDPGERGLPGKDGTPGKDADPITKEQIVNALLSMPEVFDAAVRRHLDAYPPTAGKDGEPGLPGKDGNPGKDAAPPTKEHIVDALMTMPEAFDAAVRRHLEAHPLTPAKDGEPGRPGKDGSPGKDGKPGQDGVGVAGAMIDRCGNLVITCSNGAICELGPVAGKDGDPGRDGRDGFSLSSFDATLMEDGRTVVLSFDGAEQTFAVELALPAMIYRGVWRDDRAYQRGDTVTWAGSLWHCDAAETSEKPESQEKHWTLAAKRGRDGKDLSPKPEKAILPLRVGVPTGGK